MTQVAMAAGYGSVRRVNDHFSKTYQRTPRELRNRNTLLANSNGSGLSLRLAYQKPFDWKAMLEVFGRACDARRGGSHRRSVRQNGYG